MNGLRRRVAALESSASTDPCRTCAQRPVFTFGGTAASCPEGGREPLVFTIDIERASGRKDDAA